MMISSASHSKLIPASVDPTKNRTNSNGDEKSAIIRKKQSALIKTANVFHCKYEVVRNCLTMKGFTPIEDDPVSLRSPLIWMDSGVVMTTVMCLEPWQKINHFPGMSEICRKDTLARNLNRMRREFPKHFNFYPKTWWPPANIRDFYDHHQRKPGGIYIAKPVASSQGRGIFLFKNPEDPAICDLLDPRNYNQIIIQQYLSDPFLIDRTKFDFRIYVLVTSADPLEAMIYREGLGRFATCRYEAPKSNNSGNVFMHLTNYSINKLNAEFDRDQGNGSKRTITSVMQTLAELGHNTDKLWAEIKNAIVKTLLVVAPYLARNYHASTSSHRTGDQLKSFPQNTLAEKSQCFELLGFDVIVDRKLKPYILEVNHSPSLTCDAEIDQCVKQSLLCDTLSVINISSASKTKKQYTRLTKKLSKMRLTRNNANVGAPNGPGGKKQDLLNATASEQLHRPRSPITDVKTKLAVNNNINTCGDEDNSSSKTDGDGEDVQDGSDEDDGEEYGGDSGDDENSSSSSTSAETSTKNNETALTHTPRLSLCVGGYERLYPPLQPNPIYDQILAVSQQQIALESHHTKSTSSRLAHLDAKQKREEEERQRMHQIREQMRERNRQLANVFQARKELTAIIGKPAGKEAEHRRAIKARQQSSGKTLMSVSCVDLGSDLEFQRYK